MINIDIKKPKIIKEPYFQKLKGSQGWQARVVILEGPSVAEYNQQLRDTRTKCQKILSQTESFASSHVTQTIGAQSTFNRQDIISSHIAT